MDFDFVNDDESDDKNIEPKTATSGSPNIITPEIKAAARKLAESSKGLDIAAFQREHNIYIMNVEELLGD